MSQVTAARRFGRTGTVFWTGVVVVVAVFFAGAWQRRWIADDGLIVLRTVRNLIAGNGPVFNAGERVESNTSTLWTYLIYGTHEVVGYRLELVALGLALTLSMVAVACAMLGARVMYRGTRRAPAGGPMLLLPFGVLVYVMLPPARDFASSGLETGLVICWIGVMWLGLQLWARSPHREGRSRFYGPREIARMKLIMRGRRFGFSLEDIRQWLLIYQQQGTRAQYQVWVDFATRQLDVLAAQRDEIEAAMTDLRALRDETVRLVEAMPAGESDGDAHGDAGPARG